MHVLLYTKLLSHLVFIFLGYSQSGTDKYTEISGLDHHHCIVAWRACLCLTINLHWTSGRDISSEGLFPMTCSPA